MVTSHPPSLEPVVSGDQPPSSGAHLVNLEDVSATSCIHILQRWRYENAIFLKAKNLTFLLILIDSSLNYESSSERQSAVTEHSYGWPTQPKDEHNLRRGWRRERSTLWEHNFGSQLARSSFCICYLFDMYIVFDDLCYYLFLKLNSFCPQYVIVKALRKKWEILTD